MIKIFQSAKVALLLLLSVWTATSAQAATPEDFGFGTLQFNGKPLNGRFPLLVIVFELSTNGNNRLPLRSDAVTMVENLVFNFFNVPSINGYFLENSRSMFSWQRTAVLGPVSISASETTTLDAQSSADGGDGVMRTGLDSGAGVGYLMSLLVAKTGYNFAQWDENRNGTVSPDELAIMIVGNGGERSGANRPIGARGSGIQVPGQNITLRGNIASLDHRTSFTTMAHELSHTFGTTDLYANGCMSSNLTLMSCTISGNNDDRQTYHLDPWHKIRAGWVRPRIFEMNSGGVAVIAASQINSPNTPVILYDPAKGTGEYFIVEFRSNQLQGAHHDRDLPISAGSTGTSGMAVWHVVPGNNPAVFHEGAPNLTDGGTLVWNFQTPQLTWFDGSASRTRLNPVAIISEGRELVFEWITEGDVWVDFNYLGEPLLRERGTIPEPYNALTEGVAAASHGGTIKVRSGISIGNITITKRVNIEAVGGPVTFGRP